MNNPGKVRLDALLVERGLAQSRARAVALIMAGRIIVGDKRCDKPGTAVAANAALRLRGDDIPFVSRGGLKLQSALDGLEIDVTGLDCLDVGISTGGFSDCVLQRGAARIVGIDVGYGQLAQKLRDDPRVTVFERTNVRNFDSSRMPWPADLALIDVSFIGLSLVLPAVLRCLKPDGRVLAMIKPQFEVGRGQVGKGGVVRDPALRQQAVDAVLSAAAKLGLKPLGQFESTVPGPKGNVETFVLLGRMR
ncbi:MAG: TlyA family RNA methyltransferase [Candidatus Alcyoniella australis]|nr:TlyA family RNA methyltransferase [Candidatus Alcyoniella australis]